MNDFHDIVVEYTKKRKFVTVPILEKKFRIPYSIARKEMQLMEKENVVQFQRGIVYRVAPENIEQETEMPHSEEVQEEDSEEPRGFHRPGYFSERRRVGEPLNKEAMTAIVMRLLPMEEDGSLHLDLPIILPNGAPLRLRFEADDVKNRCYITDDGCIYECLEQIAQENDEKEKNIQSMFLVLQQNSKTLASGKKLFLPLVGVSDRMELQSALESRLWTLCYFFRNLTEKPDED